MFANVFRKKGYKIGYMESHIKAILGQNLFNHISYVVISPKVVLLDMSENLVSILISLDHYRPRIMMTYILFVLPIWGRFWWSKTLMLA